MNQYIVVTRTKSFNKPGINPTTKNGTDMGWEDIISTPFTPVAAQNGWLAISSNKWIMLSACREYQQVPPPPPVPTQSRRQERTSNDGGQTWTPWEEWEKIE